MEKAIIEKYKVMNSNNIMTQHFSNNLRTDAAYRLALLEGNKSQAPIDATIMAQATRKSKEGK